MRWAFGVMLAALVAAVAVNALLLGYGGTRHDPVGHLSPVANLPVPANLRHGDDHPARSADD